MSLLRDSHAVRGTCVSCRAWCREPSSLCSGIGCACIAGRSTVCVKHTSAPHHTVIPKHMGSCLETPVRCSWEEGRKGSWGEYLLRNCYVSRLRPCCV